MWRGEMWRNDGASGSRSVKSSASTADEKADAGNAWMGRTRLHYLVRLVPPPRSRICSMYSLCVTTMNTPPAQSMMRDIDGRRDVA